MNESLWDMDQQVCNAEDFFGKKKLGVKLRIVG